MARPHSRLFNFTQQYLSELFDKLIPSHRILSNGTIGQEHVRWIRCVLVRTASCDSNQTAADDDRYNEASKISGFLIQSVTNSTNHEIESEPRAICVRHPSFLSRSSWRILKMNRVVSSKKEPRVNIGRSTLFCPRNNRWNQRDGFRNWRSVFEPHRHDWWRRSPIGEGDLETINSLHLRVCPFTSYTILQVTKASPAIMFQFQTSVETSNISI